LKLKLDENLGRRSEEILVAAGHDVSTVRQQHLEGVVDADLIERCRTEKRGLVTLDLGFANPLTFLPSRYAGIAVLRLSQKPSAAHLATLVRTLAEALESEQLEGKLWIVESGRVRIYQEETRNSGEQTR
jgi:predicted nuclease of predicted toxin-antitoxin system